MKESDCQSCEKVTDTFPLSRSKGITERRIKHEMFSNCLLLGLGPREEQYQDYGTNFPKKTIQIFQIKINFHRDIIFRQSKIIGGSKHLFRPCKKFENG